MESSVARPHVPDEELHAYCDGELSPPQRVEIAEHLLGCLICRAAHAEVGELRARATSLLAIAAPRTIRRPALPIMRPAQRRRLSGMAAAAAIAVIGTGVWFSVQPGRGTNATQLASTLVAPGLLSGGHRVIDVPPAKPELERIAADTATIRVIAPGPASVSFGHASHDADPALVRDWPNADWDNALVAAHGSLGRVPGVLVTAVRVRDIQSTRPMFMVRQELGDGQPVWVFDAPAGEFAAVNQSLRVSGMTASAPMRTLPGYATADSAASRPTRLIVVAGYLPVDSLNALAARLTLR